MKNRKLIIAVSGASGAVYAKLLIEKLATIKSILNDTAIVFSDTAAKVWEYELQEESKRGLPFRVYDDHDLFSPPASGSAGYDTMIICPCSMGTLGRIASGVADTLITRAADVMLKERRKLILLTREMPLSLIHLKNMETITLAGGIICPASPSFYSIPKTTDEILMSVIWKILDLSGIEHDGFEWKGK